MSLVKNKTRKLIYDYKNGKITRERFKKEIRLVENNFQGGNWRTISLAAQKYLSEINITPDSRFDMASAIIEVFPKSRMEQTWANETVERVHENK